ncbi:MAG: hypothetical protein ACRD3L_05295 [Terriglobales bacterium]
MKNISRWLLCLVVVVGAASWGMAQYNDSGAKGKATVRTIKGCLTQADNGKDFVLKASDGSKWDLESDTVSLGEHVGHTVAVTGAVEHATAHNLKEDSKDAMADAHMKKDNTESGDLKVTNLKMVSDSCK